MANKEEFSELIEEILDLAGVPFTEADEPEVDELTDEEPKEDNPEKEDKEPEEELSDDWEITIGTTGTIKVEWHESYVYVWYRKRKSEKMQIPNKLRPYKDEVSEFMNKILSYVERVS